MEEQEQIIINSNENVTSVINNLFTNINYIMVAALVILLIYMTIRDYTIRKSRKRMEMEISEYCRLDNKNDKENRE